MKKVVVTGATGFIGRHSLPFLVRSGYEVHAVFSKAEPIQKPGVVWHQANLLDHSQATALISKVKPTHLLHLAWHATPGKCWTSSLNLDWVQASIHLLKQFISHAGIKFVGAGTCAEYDWTLPNYSEDAFCKPATLYGACKNAVYQVARAFCKQAGISFGWGRIFYLYGPYENPERFVPAVIQKLLKNEIAPCSHGEQIRDFLHVEDVAAALTRLLETSVEGAVNIASGRGVKLKEISNKIASRLGGKKLIQLGALQAPPSDPPYLVATTHRLNEELHWTPTYTLDNGLEQTIDWWRSQS